MRRALTDAETDADSGLTESPSPRGQGLFVLEKTAAFGLVFIKNV